MRHFVFIHEYDTSAGDSLENIQPPNSNIE
jgi:hypothetical protein